MIQVITHLGLFTLGIVIGAKFYKMILESNIEKENKKVLDNLNKQFSEVLNNIRNGYSEFKSRINSTVYIQSVLIDHGTIDIIFFMNKNDIAIFQGDKCLYTSEKVDKQIVANICKEINKRYDKQISDVVNFLGLIFSKDEFEKTFKMDASQLQNLMKGQVSESSDVDNIINDNKTKFDIDEILDKISAQGINSLTFEERLFLDKYSNEKGN